MSEKKRKSELDYFSYFKKLYESWEKSMSQALEIWLKNPLLTNTTERAIEKSAEFKNYIHDIMERTLNQRHFPMRDDMDKIITSLDKLQTRVSELSERINEIQVAEKPTLKKVKPKTRRKNRNERGKV
jgi:division protein CdvB (Snf7/Vps24/ESCRT-III family)